LTRACSSISQIPQASSTVLSHGRQLIILASEEYSLFSLLIPVGRSRDLEAFLEPFRRRLRELFENIGIWNMAFLPCFRFCNRTNQSLIGSQNELWRLAKGSLNDGSKPASASDLLEIERDINSAPMSYLAMDSPREALWKQQQKILEQS
jgi:hypothetical protein